MVTHNSSQDQTSHVSPPLSEREGCENQEENTTSQFTPEGNEAVQTEEAVKIEEETVKLEEENVKLEEINHTRPRKQNYSMLLKPKVDIQCSSALYDRETGLRILAKLLRIRDEGKNRLYSKE